MAFLRGAQTYSYRQRPYTQKHVASYTRANTPSGYTSHNRPVVGSRRFNNKNKKDKQIVTKAWVKSHLEQRGINFVKNTVPDMQPATLNTYIIGNGIAKGTDLGDRVGDSVFMKGLELKFKLQNDNSTFPVLLRLFVVQELRPNESISEDLFEPESDTFTPIDLQAANSMQIYKNINKRKYKVLFDRVYNVPAKLPNTGYNNQIYDDVYVPINRRITYSTETTTAVYTSPSIVLCWFVQSPTELGAFPINTVNRVSNYREYFIK